MCSCAAEGGRARIGAALCSVVKQAALSLPVLPCLPLSWLCCFCRSSAGNRDVPICFFWIQMYQCRSDNNADISQFFLKLSLLTSCEGLDEDPVKSGLLFRRQKKHQFLEIFACKEMHSNLLLPVAKWLFNCSIFRQLRCPSGNGAATTHKKKKERKENEIGDQSPKPISSSARPAESLLFLFLSVSAPLVVLGVC